MALSLHHSLPTFRPQTATRLDAQQCPNLLSPASRCMAMVGGAVTGAEFSRASANSLLTGNPCGGGEVMNVKRRISTGWVNHRLVSPRWVSQRQQAVGGGGGVGVVAKDSGASSKESKSVMIDPVEAKRLAALEMAKIRAEILFQKNRRAEAINGGWAVLGLTAGIVVEGLTSRGIVVQLQSYWVVLVQFLDRIGAPSS